MIFLDNTLFPKIAEILRLLEYQVAHLQEQFDPGTPDVDWIAEAGASGWIIISSDQRILTRPAEHVALKKANVVSYFRRKPPPP